MLPLMTMGVAGVSSAARTSNNNPTLVRLASARVAAS
jgi:hypothetical protein